MAFWHFFSINLKMIFRDRKGIFWTVVMPAAIFTILSVLPIGKFIESGINYSVYLLPGLLAMTIMQGGIYGLAYWMVDLRARGVLRRFTVAPVSKFDFIAGVVAARLVVMLIQIIILSFLAVLVFGVHIPLSVFFIPLFLVLGGSVFLLFGLLISTLAGSYDAAAPLTAGIGLPLTFLGNIFYPVDNLPRVLQWVANILPMRYLSDIFRMFYLDAFSPHVFWLSVGMLGVWFVLICGLVGWKFKLSE